VGILRAASLLAGVDVITVRVDDVPIEGRRAAAAALRRAGLTCLHADGLRAAAAQESAIRGTDRTTRGSTDGDIENFFSSIE
jgi:hypothetical protein